MNFNSNIGKIEILVSFSEKCTKNMDIELKNDSKNVCCAF